MTGTPENAALVSERPIGALRLELADLARALHSYREHVDFCLRLALMVESRRAEIAARRRDGSQ
jgi:hypothetical protein